MIAVQHLTLPGRFLRMLAVVRRYTRDPDFVFRRIGAEILLLPIRLNTGDLESIYSLNEVGALVWDLLGTPRSLAELRERVVDEFEVAADVAERDVEAFLVDLATIGGVRTS